MATCPKCGGHLTSSHRCRRTLPQIIADIVLGGLVGGAWALAMAAVFDHDGITADFDAVFFLGGAVVAIGTQTWLRQRR